MCVRGGGHNHAGYAVGDGALMLDLSAMVSVRVDPARRAVTVGGGATWGMVDQATQAAGLAVTGADVSAVGVGGSTLGGGAGWLHRMLGLSCDNLLAAEIVTADAEVLRVSAQEHPELLWALRGGGGNFGAVTSFTFALHPVGPVQVGVVICPMVRAADALAAYQHLCETGGDELFVRAMLVTAPPAPFVPEPLRGRPAVILSAAWFGPPGQAESVLRGAAPVRAPGRRPAAADAVRGAAADVGCDGAPPGPRGQPGRVHRPARRRGDRRARLRGRRAAADERGHAAAAGRRGRPRQSRCHRVPAPATPPTTWPSTPSRCPKTPAPSRPPGPRR